MSVKIPAQHAVIPREKLTLYLLAFRAKSDKSALLARAGFTQDNPEALENAIRQHLAKHEAGEDRRDEYGRFYRVEGDLVGVNGVRLKVVTVWVAPANQPDTYRFITLKPG